MIRVIAIVLFLVLAGGEARARLGERRPQIEAIYGTPFKEEKDGPMRTCQYKWKSWHIIVGYKNGVSILETYTPLDGRRITEAEALQLLKNNGGGNPHDWDNPRVDVAGDGKSGVWRRRDNKAMGMLPPELNYFMITEPGFELPALNPAPKSSRKP